MPRKSSIKTLPKDVLARLNAQLADGHRTLDELVAWLDGEGHPRSRSAIHRHAQAIEKVQAKLRQSREITEAVTKELGDAAAQGKQGRLLVEMARSIVFDMLMKLQEVDDEGNAIPLGPRDVAFLGKGLAELGRALRFDQDFEQKIRQQIAEEERKAAAERAVSAADEQSRKAGHKLPPEALKAIREQVYGIVEAE